MTDALSIFAAAREVPRTVALKYGSASFTFADLAELTRDRLRRLAR